MSPKRKAPGAAEDIAATEAAHMVAARQATTQAKERALAMVLAEIITTVELSDEARERLSELMGGDADGS